MFIVVFFIIEQQKYVSVFSCKKKNAYVLHDVIVVVDENVFFFCKNCCD